jgi:hypothetical protein
LLQPSCLHAAAMLFGSIFLAACGSAAKSSVVGSTTPSACSACQPVSRLPYLYALTICNVRGALLEKCEKYKDLI